MFGNRHTIDDRLLVHASIPLNVDPPPKLRVVKKHIEARRYVACVVDYSDPAGSIERRRRTGVGYPQVYRASTEGWTKAAREECEAWIADQS